MKKVCITFLSICLVFLLALQFRIFQAEKAEKDEPEQRVSKAKATVTDYGGKSLDDIIKSYKNQLQASSAEKKENKQAEQTDDKEEDFSDQIIITTYEVDSTCLSEIGYDETDNILLVRFRDSGIYYAYYDVPLSECKSLYSAESIGLYFNQFIRNNYDYKRLD